MSESSLSLVKMVSRLLVLLSLLRLCREGVCHFTAEPLAAAFGRLDLTELQERLFEIKISDQPVTHESSATVGNNQHTVTVWSKYGQQYSCVLPPRVSDAGSDDRLVALDDNMVNITELLLPMRGMCYYKNEGWWTYQYCHGEEVTQFHIEAGKTVGTTIVLGKYAGEKQWEKDELLTVMKRQSMQSLHAKSVDFTAMTASSHEAEYVNGTLCNLNGRLRQANVKLICNLHPSSKTAILKVVEETTCNYSLIVHSPLLCDHPAFKPPSHNKLVSITCSPVVSDDRYQEYLRQAEEHMQQKLAKQEESVSAEKQQVFNEKARPNKLPLNVVLNSLASTVVEELNQRKEAKKRGDTGRNIREEGRDDDEEEDVFESEEVDAMIEEMVAKTLENMMGMKMPQPRGTAATDQQALDPEQQQQQTDSIETRQQQSTKQTGEKDQLEDTESAVRETSKQDSGEAIQVKVYMADQQNQDSGTKVVELEADSSNTDDVASMLSGIIGELMEVENDELHKRKKKQESLELSYARSWKKRKQEKEK